VGLYLQYLRKGYHQTKEAYIYSDHKMQIHVDGEVLGIAPVSVKIVPKALYVIAASQNVI
jgi:diacylglycerol kinase family enzyme